LAKAMVPVETCVDIMTSTVMLPTMRVILILLLATMQLASAGLSSAIVLCVGSNGHVAVELLHNVCDPPASRDASNDDCCCQQIAACPNSTFAVPSDCQDLPLPAANPPVSARELQQFIAPHQALLPALPTGQLLPPLEPRVIAWRTITGESFLMDDPVHRTLQLASHRSVTLLI
jgi:hypothetical protein